jgi:hypothetical protein
MKQQIADVIHRYGEPVELFPKVGLSSFLTASVQRPSSEGVVNEYREDAFVVYIAADDVAVAPLRFDRIRIRGDMRTIDEVQTEVMNGVTLVYRMQVQG